jgi:hypothetical protein
LEDFKQKKLSKIPDPSIPLVVFKHFGRYIWKLLAISDHKFYLLLAEIRNENCVNLSIDLSMYCITIKTLPEANSSTNTFKTKTKSTHKATMEKIQNIDWSR